MNNCIKFLFLIIFLTTFSQAYGEIYLGDVKILSASLEINSSGTVSGKYVLKNMGNNPENLELSFPGYSNTAKILVDETIYSGSPVLFDTSQVIKINVEDSFLDSRHIIFNPEILVNNSSFDSKIDRLTLSLNLENPNSLISSSLPLVLRENRDYESNYLFEGSSIYFRIIDITTSPYSYKLTATRDNSEISTQGEILKVTSTLINSGEEDILNVTLMDSFSAAYFYPVNTLEFSTSSGNDLSYIFKKNFEVIPSGTTEIISYEVYVKDESNMRLFPLRVFSNGYLIASVEGEHIGIKKDAPLQESYPQEINLSGQILDSIPLPLAETYNIPDNSLKEGRNLSSTYRWLIVFISIFLVLFIIFRKSITNYIKEKILVKSVYARNSIANNGGFR